MGPHPSASRASLGHWFRDTTLNYGSSVFAGALQLIILVLLARTLTKPAVGVIVLSTAISSTIATAAEFGLGPTHRDRIPKYAPAPSPTGPVGRARFVKLCLLTATITASGVAVGAIAAIAVVAAGGKGGIAEAIGFGLATGATVRRIRIHPNFA